LEIGVRLEQAGLVASPPSTEEARKVREIARIEQERIRTFRDPVESDTWAFRPVTDLDPKAAKSLAGAGVGEILRAWADTLPDPLPDAVELEALARGFCEQRGLGFGHLVHPVRAALTGRSSGPPLFDCLHVLGREEARRRLVAAAGRAAAGGGAA
jgi:glutamyl-tRNA synthetase